MHRVFAVLVVGAGFLVSAPIVISGARSSQNAAQPLAPESDSKPFQYEGVGSCAAQACHGGTEHRRTGSEYTTWATRDPHTRAYAVLLEDRSVHMAKVLGIGAAHESALCLKCHATYSETVSHAERLTLTDGVGCESCHGPAEKWLDLHRYPEWKLKSPHEKQQYGMTDLKDLLVRARLCVSCHIGSPDREVNHDLIAAGHPRLSFELGAFVSNLPKHWAREIDATERQAHPYLEAKFWALGQVLSAEASLDLLEARIEGNNGGKRVWPEFAEYDCYSCHHSLDAQSWRLGRAKRENTRPGQVPWGTWFYPTVGSLGSQLGLSGSDTVKTDLSELHRQLAGLPARPANLRPVIDRVRKQLAGWANEIHRQSLDGEKNRSLLAGSASGLVEANRHWDPAIQQVLAVFAAVEAERLARIAKGEPVPERFVSVLARLEEIITKLQYPNEYRPESVEQFMTELERLLER